MRASELEVKNVGKEEEITFLNDNHYQGFIGSEVCLGLYSNNNELIELMSFGKPRYTNKFDWELLRLCTKKDMTVYGGASRLLKHFYKGRCGSIISYCNESKFTGKVYDAMGFTKVGTCNSYHYEKDGKRYHRSNFQKRVCLKLWPQYIGKNITEAQIMKEQGYTRVEEVQATWVYNDNCKYYIYEIENNGYHYIGQHCYRDTTEDNYFGSGTIIKRLNKKYGNGVKTILLDNINTREEANKYERCAIFYNKVVYGDKNVNILKGGQDSLNSTYRPISSASYGFVGKSHSEETRRKISESGKGKHNHKGVNNPNYGKHHTHSEETKRRISEATKGENNPMFGKKRTDLKDTVVLYRLGCEIHTRQEWKELGYDVYYPKNRFTKLGRIRDFKKQPVQP